MELHKFNSEQYKKTGKRAFSFDYAAKNKPQDVVKLRSKNSQGAAEFKFLQVLHMSPVRTLV